MASQRSPPGSTDEHFPPHVRGRTDPTPDAFHRDLTRRNIETIRRSLGGRGRDLHGVRPVRKPLDPDRPSPVEEAIGFLRISLSTFPESSARPIPSRSIARFRFDRFVLGSHRDRLSG